MEWVKTKDKLPEVSCYGSCEDLLVATNGDYYLGRFLGEGAIGGPHFIIQYEGVYDGKIRYEDVNIADVDYWCEISNPYE